METSNSSLMIIEKMMEKERRREERWYLEVNGLMIKGLNIYIPPLTWTWPAAVCNLKWRTDHTMTPGGACTVQHICCARNAVVELSCCACCLHCGICCMFGIVRSCVFYTSMLSAHLYQTAFLNTGMCTVYTIVIYILSSLSYYIIQSV